MSTLVIAFAFIFGTIVGSFLNVLIFRYHSGRGISGRSACLHCGMKLNWYELIPIFSYIFQRGRCRSCGAKISYQYPLVEVVTGTVFSVVIGRQLGIFATGVASNLQFTINSLQTLIVICYFLFAWSILIAITAYDLRHKIIPNGWVWLFIGLSFIKVISSNFSNLLNLSNFLNFITSPDFLAGPLLALPFALIWFLSGGRAMGFGDAKLALGIGWMLGFSGGVSAILLSFWIGGLAGLYLLSRRGSGYNMKSEVPFAPFLTVAAFAEYLFNFDFFGLSGLFR